ncbi:MAG: 4-(cytidine 5'-diphospho)-2-C-methyl-D-erythritol kinase [Clostridia bacterium]|nr:4-(cytidine 5'-diphospho)-2-C-methyl-D-erythritol kinase [Clostridia bacterium]
MKTESRSETRPNRVEETAPAKVNLILSVGARRADGYHELVSLMETVSLCDKLTFEADDSVLPGIKLSILGKYRVPKDPSNLVIRAAEAFFAAAGTRFGVYVLLEKNIPTEAGLGGGSADAAATLRALNRMAGSPLSSAKLCEIASTLGADVPFCLFGGTAICRGIGDVIEPVSNPARRFYTVVMGSDRVSTAGAYRALDEQSVSSDVHPARPTVEEILSLARGGAVRLLNDFESVVFSAHPVIAERKRRLLSLGATDALMSGSGAAVFGLFSDPESASRAASAFGDADAFVVESVRQYYS